MDEGEEENIGRLLLPRKELRVPLGVAVEAVLVVISEQDVEPENFTRPSWVAALLYFQPCVCVLVAVIMGSRTRCMCVVIAVAVIVFMVVGVSVGAATMGVGVGVLIRVSVASAMVGCVAMTWAFVVFPIHHNARKLRPVREQ